jgi:hypothetical protein
VRPVSPPVCAAHGPRELPPFLKADRRKRGIPKQWRSTGDAEAIGPGVRNRCRAKDAHFGVGSRASPSEKDGCLSTSAMPRLRPKLSGVEAMCHHHPQVLVRPHQLHRQVLQDPIIARLFRLKFRRRASFRASMLGRSGTQSAGSGPIRRNVVRVAASTRSCRDGLNSRCQHHPRGLLADHDRRRIGVSRG